MPWLFAIDTTGHPLFTVHSRHPTCGILVAYIINPFIESPWDVIVIENVPSVNVTNIGKLCWCFVVLLCYFLFFVVFLGVFFCYANTKDKLLLFLNTNGHLLALIRRSSDFM